MRRNFRVVVLLALLVASGSASAHAGKVTLLLEQPYGHLGMFTPTGHVAIYLSSVCAETPVHLRRCDPGEKGVVLSRYHKVGGYDWLAVPLIPYLYAVAEPQDIPEGDVSRPEAMRLRNQYRREYLREYIPDDPDRAIPDGNWTELLGESYIRKIYGYSLETTPEQDDELIAMLNDHKNRSRYNLVFRNCANFAEDILNFYFPHSVHRNFIVDFGIMTPKQTARSFAKYAKKHSDLEFTTFVIPQVPGTIARSTSVHGILDSFLETPKYVLPLAVLHPIVAGSLLAVYFGDGRFHAGAHIEAVFDPRQEAEPGMGIATNRHAAAEAAENHGQTQGQIQGQTGQSEAQNRTGSETGSETGSMTDVSFQSTALGPAE